MAKPTNQPMQKGVAKVPVVMQLEALECGAACLDMVLAYYGKWVPLEQIRSDCGVSRDGSNAKSVMRAARHYGLKAQGFRCEPEALRAEGSFPCIIHWNFNHFVVLKGFRGNKAYLNDPARGEVVVPMETFDESFTGVCLMFEPDEGFEPSGAPKSMLDFVAKRLKGTGPAIAFAVLTAVIATLMNVINPVFSRVFFDRLLTQQTPQWAGPFFVALLLFNIVQLVVAALRAIYNLRINGKMAAIGNTTYMWKVLHLPIGFFTQRMAGDIQGRQSSNAQIANTLINTFAPLALNAVMMVFYLVVMVRYSMLLTLVGLGSMAINAAVSNYISKKRTNVTRVSMRDAAKLSSATVAGIEMIETIKSSGAENGYFAKWAGYQASVNTQNVRFLKLNQYMGMVPQFVSSVANYAVLVLGVWLVMRGEFTVGMISAFQGFMASFMSPASSLVSSGQMLQEMRTQMERIDDVMEYPDDDAFAPEPADEGGLPASKLAGRIEMRDVEFGYSPLSKPLIEHFDLTLEPGRSVAVVGGSGCGKSTITKLICGLIQPWSGQILFDGKPTKEIPKSLFSASLAVVDQDIVLFKGTIADNIRMWDNSITDEAMTQAARDAQIHDDIVARPGGYQHMLIEGGKDFSGGQRQRIEIARVLAQEPTVVVMDEATSALDAKTEHAVVEAIRARGIATVVVAHRLSTIRSCDEIIVMDHGKVVARGTHDELMEGSEAYRNLVTSE